MNLENLVDYLALRDFLQERKGPVMKEFDYGFLQTTIVLLVVILLISLMSLGGLVMFSNLI